MVCYCTLNHITLVFSLLHLLFLKVKTLKVIITYIYILNHVCFSIKTVWIKDILNRSVSAAFYVLRWVSLYAVK